jgi:cardiolipin hydrolase
MHLKLSIIDDKTACGGSYNYTSNATKENDENLIVMRDPNIVSDYVNEFNSMWNNTSDYTNY